jgi:hypothetical protein
MQIDDKFIDQLDDNFLQILIDILKNGIMAVEPARAITREYLALKPFPTFQDLKTKIKDFVTKHNEFAKINIFILQKEEDEKTQGLLTKMKDLMNQNRVEEALNLVKPQKQ